MTVINEVKYVRELLEKDMNYLKDKVCNIEKKMDERLKHVEEQIEQNTEFRKKFKWTGMMIGSVASIAGFLMTIIAFKMQWLGR